MAFQNVSGTGAGSHPRLNTKDVVGLAQPGRTERAPSVGDPSAPKVGTPGGPEKAPRGGQSTPMFAEPGGPQGISPRR